MSLLTTICIILSTWIIIITYVWRLIAICIILSAWIIIITYVWRFYITATQLMACSDIV